MAEIITKNPFRILGVAANASPRDIVTNQNKMKAFMRVNRPVSFPLDLSEILGEPERTLETITAADTTLTIKTDRMRAALFWWINGETAFDQTAFRHIEAGSLDAALNLWEKQENMSSLANSALVHLIKGNHRPAAVAMSKMLERFHQEFAKAVDVPSGTQAEMVEAYVTTVLNQWPNVDLNLIIGAGFPESWNQASRGAIVEPIVAALEAALQKSRLTKDKDFRTRYKAGETLDEESAPLFRQLRKVVKINDVQLVSISDKIANEILQCSIDAYNSANDLEFADQAIVLLRRAKVIALGSMTKERIKENEQILNNNLASLPPKAVRAENEELTKVCKDVEGYAQTPGTAQMLLDRARPILQRISQKLPPNDQAFAITCNSMIVNYALNILIEYVNSAQRTIAGITDVDLFKNMRDSISEARDVTLKLSSLKVDSSTEQRLRQNIITIRDICGQLAEVKTESSVLDNLSGCWIYVIIAVIIMLLRSC